MKFQCISDHRESYPIRTLAKVFRVSPSGYYRWSKNRLGPRQKHDYELTRTIEDIHQGSRGTYGSPRIFRMLKALGHRCSKSKVERLMEKNGIRARRKRKFRNTTQSKHKHPIAENILKRDFTTKEPNLCWVSDITYVPTDEGWLYLAAVLDLYSRKVVGWAMSERINEELTLSALEMAIEHRQPSTGLIHHSDRGSQYAANKYRQQLEKIEALSSMSRKGNCWDNAVAESFFHTIKTEFIQLERFGSRREAQLKIFEWIEVFYNRQRIHSTLGYLSPAQYESKRKCA